ncbi:hypothetical protein SK128_009677 [Halocaridina rubra]|uniref:Major facilitator superfamily (MFS) profile domain-containing protein n=1 Tax=Halocaridina rubra TaxID=373956 RepID=A0AAN8WHN9_HALRR
MRGPVEESAHHISASVTCSWFPALVLTEAEKPASQCILVANVMSTFRARCVQVKLESFTSFYPTESTIPPFYSSTNQHMLIFHLNTAVKRTTKKQNYPINSRTFTLDSEEFVTINKVYATEIAEPSIRGLMGAFPEAAVALGSLLCYIFGAAMDWRWLAITSAVVPGIPLFISMILLPESPQWLIKKGKLDAAQRALTFFRSENHNIKKEMDLTYSNIMATEGAEISVWEQCRLFRKSQNWKPTLIVFLVFMCGQFSGFAVVTAYTVDIFNEANTNVDSNTATIIVGLIRFLSTLVSAALLDRTGRKPLLIISAIGSSIGMLSIGVFFYLKANSYTEGLRMLPLASLLIYVFFNELGYGPIPWLLSGELIPLAVRTIGNGVAVTAYSLFAFVIGLTFPHLTSLLPSFIVFWLYALFSLSGVALGIYLPETRGKTLEEIELFFAPKPKTLPDDGQP